MPANYCVMLLKTLCVLMLFAGSVSATELDFCIKQLGANLTIGEKDLLDVKARWPRRHVILGELRAMLLRNTGYADSLGALHAELKVFELGRCEIIDSTVTNPSEMVFSVRLYNIRGIEGDIDEGIFVVVFRDSSIQARCLIAALQTSCEQTFLRACFLLEDRAIRCEQLRHDFDCEKDEFLQTTALTGLTIRLGRDGSIIESIDGEEARPEPIIGDQE